jgi:hypothetical protein
VQGRLVVSPVLFREGRVLLWAECNSNNSTTYLSLLEEHAVIKQTSKFHSPYHKSSPPDYLQSQINTNHITILVFCFSVSLPSVIPFEFPDQLLYCLAHINIFDIVTCFLGSRPIQRFVATQQLCKYATILQALLGSLSRCNN